MSLSYDDDNAVVRQILELAATNNPFDIDQFLIYNDDDANYKYVTLAARKIIHEEFCIEKIRTLMATYWQDIGICIDGFTLMQWMVMENLKVDSIRSVADAGIFVSALSEKERETVITITLMQLQKEKRNRYEILEYIQIIEFFLNCEQEPSFGDLVSLAFIFYFYQNVLSNDLKQTLKNLKSNSETFNILISRLEFFGDGEIISDRKITVTSFFQMEICVAAKILPDEEFANALNYHLFQLQPFRKFFQKKLDDVKELSKLMPMAIETLVNNLPIVDLCAHIIIKYLSKNDLENMNMSFL